jgi:hypothetical protein
MSARSRSKTPRSSAKSSSTAQAELRSPPRQEGRRAFRNGPNPGRHGSLVAALAHVASEK